MARRMFIVAWCLLAAVKLMLAFAMPLFGDEAFYWWESRHLAWSYSDVPPMTAWLIALGTSVFPGEIGVRAPFLVLGLLLPWQMVAITRRWYGADAAWWAGLLAIVMPLAAAMGILALPDVPLVTLSLLSVAALVTAMQRQRLRDWAVLGLWLALGMLCHYRFAALPLVLAAVMIALPAGRQALASAGPWLATGIAGLGLLPLFWFNLGTDFSALRFQALDRHPWAWQWSGFWQAAEQLLMASPLLLLLLAWTVKDALTRTSDSDSTMAADARTGQSPETIVLLIAVGLWLLFFVLGFFADSERFRWHWPLPAFVLLLPMLAARMERIGPLTRMATVATAMALTGAMLAYFALTIAPDRAGHWLGGKRFPDNFSGWREVADWLPTPPPATPVVVDNFMLAATLSFYHRGIGDNGIRVLDDARNAHHGRAVQLAIWDVDETSLRHRPGQPGWLVAEESARRFSDRWAWYQSLCARFEGLELDDALHVFGDRKRFVRWRYDGYLPQADCKQPDAIPPLGWVETEPLSGVVRAGDDFVVKGWAIHPELGIDVVTVFIDGVQVARTGRDVEIFWVENHWGEVGDPAGRMIGYRVELSGLGLAPGRHRIDVEVLRGDGRTWPLSGQDLIVRR